MHGQINWTLYVKSDCYRGLDQEKNVKFTVLPAHAVTRVKNKIFLLYFTNK